MRMVDQSAVNRQLAVLIDAENIPVSTLREVLDEIARLGAVSVRRAYGDFTMASLKGWRAEMLALAIQPMQQFRNISGKSVTDSTLIIDAMDMLHSRKFSGFCILSSDSDFTRLAMRIREDGLPVYGFGEQKTPQAFVRACTKFVDIQLLRADSAALNGAAKKKPAIGKPALKILRAAVETVEDETGWASLGRVGAVLGSRHPEFDSRAYGFRKLSDLFIASELVEYRLNGEKGGPQHAFVKLRRA